MADEKDLELNENEEDEVAIFRYKEEEQMLEPIEDENLLEEVFEFYQNEDIPEEE